MNSPSIEEPATAGNKVNRLAVRRPAGLVVPVLAVAKPNPWSACRARHVNGRVHARRCIGCRLKGNPLPVWGKVCLVDVGGRTGDYFFCCSFRMRGVSDGNQPYFEQVSIGTL